MIESAKRFPAIPVPAIGDYWRGEGGLYAGIMPDYTGNRPYHLIVSADEAVGVSWGGHSRTEDRARSQHDGEANSKALTQCPHPHPAARWATSYRKDGHDDLHLPARRELDVAMAALPEHFTASDWYWSSTDRTTERAWGRTNNVSALTDMYKTFEGRARAVRRIFVPQG